LAKEKAHDIFFQAAKIVIEKYPDIKFLVIGDGPLRGSLEIMAKELGLSKNVIFTGIRNDMAQVYAMCDLMVNASYIEGLPMTILEAMAARVPIIATRVGAVPKVIDDQRNGMSLEPGDAVTLASAITGLIEDPQKRKRFADAAYKDVCDRFSDERMAQRYRAIYQEILLSK
jgi:glycosyltransferase involved in cell wall biosynthesis